MPASVAETPLYIIVQAGGRGSRLRHHTWNKPKCLVSLDGTPLLYHLFNRFPSARFMIIGGYAFDVLKNYLQVNPPKIEYELIQANTQGGTSSGISQALEKIPANARLLLSWSDLIIHHLPPWTLDHKPVIYTTSNFTCRWSITETGAIKEIAATVRGIPGLFFFPQASMLPAPPDEGEFVHWLSISMQDYSTIDCPDIEELGDFTAIELHNKRSGFSRFFNKIDIKDTQVQKTVVDSDYATLHQHEVAWYREAHQLGFKRIPRVYSENPLTLEKIKGRHAYEMLEINANEKRALLKDYLDTLMDLHQKSTAPNQPSDIEQVYLSKTRNRVLEIARLIPGFERADVTVNGKKCRNPFTQKHINLLDSLLPRLMPKQFVPIHGDPTFSNTIIDHHHHAWFIDPRGYFAQPGIMGDAYYDFAKVYYSAVGGYDSFNRKKFKLYMDNETVEVLMDKPLFADVAQELFNDYFATEIHRIEIIHGLIWLSLTAYAKDDVDSIIASFYLGLYWLEIGMNDC